MGVVKNFMVRVGADFSSISKQSDKARQSLSKMQSSVTKSCSRMTTAVSGMNRVFGMLGVTLSAVGFAAFSKKAKEAYETQEIAETKLATVMRQRMSASDDEIKKIYELTAAQQKLGVIEDEIQLTGAQQLSTFLKETNSLKVLIPAMNNLVAQQKGLNATTGDAYTVANMMGKAMQGQYTALRRVGITFTDAEAAVLQYGNEEQRAAMLAQIITNNVGPMNQALAATPSGRLKQVSNALGDIKEQFGGAITNALTVFLPALNVICSVLASMANLASRVAQAIANVFGRSASTAASTVSYTAAAADSMADLADSTNAAGNAGAKAKKSLGSFGFDTLQKLSSSGASGGSGSSSGGTGGTGGGISGGNLPGSEEVGESVGWLERGLDKLKKTVESFNFEPLRASFDNLKKSVKPIWDAFVGGLDWAFDNVLVPIASWTISSALPATLDVAAGAANVFSAALDALKPLGDWLWTKFLQPIGKWAGGKITGALKKLADRLNGISDWIKKHKSTVRGLAVVLGSFAAAWGVASAALSIWIGTAKIGSAVTTTFKAAIGFLTSPVGLVVVAIAALIAVIVALVKNWDKVRETAQKVWAEVKDAWKAAGEWFKSTVLTPIKNAFSTAWSSISGFVTGAWTKAKSIWAEVKKWFDTTLLSPVKTAFSSAWDSVSGFVTGAWTKAKSVWNGVSSWFSTNVTGPIKNTFRSFANSIIGFFEGLVNKGIAGINALIDGANKIKFNVPDWVPKIGGRSVGFNLSRVSTISLPRLAKGAVFEGNDPYLAVVNDQKHGVNIESPLSTIIEAMNIALRQNGAAGGGQVEVINHVSFEGTLSALARALVPAITAEIKRTGNSATAKGMA